MSYFDDTGAIIEVTEPDIYFDDPPEPEVALGEKSMDALLCVTFELGQWSGHDPIKEFASRTVLRQEAQSPARFAKEHKVSSSFVRRRIREAHAVIGSASDADR